MGGLFGIVTKGNCSRDLYYGTDYHTHLGTQFGGLAVYGDSLQRKIHDISKEQFKGKFHSDYKGLVGKYGIGAISAVDEQPIALNSKFGKFALVMNGNVQNLETIAEEMLKEGISFNEVRNDTLNATEVVAKIITRSNSLIEGIENVFDKIEGSVSILLVNKEGVYAARDRLGVNPLILGEREGDFAVTTETTAFQNLHFNYKKDLKAGEIILLDKEGVHTKVDGKENGKTCAFLWIYTGFPSSKYDGISVASARNNCGKMLARTDRALGIKADCVTGVPASGTSYAIKYAEEAGIPFEDIFNKFTPGYSRSYTPPSQTERDLIAKMKLLVVPELIKGKKIIVCEDSIVRGTQLKSYTVDKLWENGAKEIHVRPACPPLLEICGYNISTRNKEELIAQRAIRDIEGKFINDFSDYLNPNSAKYKKMVEWIRKDLNVTSVLYPNLDEMAKAIGKPKEKMCTYCWNGKKLTKSN